MKLSSGREVEVRTLTVRERQAYRDKALRLNKEHGIAWSCEDNLDLVQLVTGLDDEKMADWKDVEIDECAAEIIKGSFLDELDKKK